MRVKKLTDLNKNEYKEYQDNINLDFETSFNQNATSLQPYLTKAEREYFLNKLEYFRNNLSIFRHGFKLLEKKYPEKKWNDIINLSSDLCKSHPVDTKTSSIKFLQTYGALSSATLLQEKPNSEGLLTHIFNK